MKNTHDTIRRLRRIARAKTQKGLTLIEILVVLAIIGIAMGFLVKNVFSMGDEAKASLTRTKMDAAKGPLYLYQMRNNTLPQDLRALESVDATDAWNRPIQYRLLDGGRSYELRSLGSDGREGGSGAGADITVTGP